MRVNQMKLFKKQNGISLFGLIFSLGILAAFAMLAMKVAPTVIEYMAVKKAIVYAKSAGTTAFDIQQAFDKQAEVSYITSIHGKELTIARSGDDIEVSFSYQKKIPLMGPASLVLDYQGTTAKNGVVAKKPE